MAESTAQSKELSNAKSSVQNNEGWVKTTCAYCGVGCGVEARPKMSGELEIRGDQDHPSNYGKLCTKGIALGDTVIHDGRLLKPIDQRLANGQALSWDQASELVAEKFASTIDQYGPDSVAFYVSGQLLTEDYYLANKLIKGFIGTGNIDSNSRLCMASSVVGHKRAFGTDTVPVCYQDLEQAELVILVGSNLAWCHPVLFQRLRSAKQKNPQLKVVVVDPRRTDSCSIAESHLAINSGADVALFNGLLNYLAKHQHLDANFIAEHTNHFEQALASAEQALDLELITGLSSEQLENFYADFASTDKVITVYSQGVNQSSSGSDKVNSIINCHLASGKIGKVGTGPFSVTGQPNAMGGREVGALANTLASHMEFDNPEHHQLISDFWQTDKLATQPGLKAVDMFDAMADGKIKAVWIIATNPMVSLPNTAKIKAALEACPFVVVSDCIADTETSRLADIVLPAQGWSEKSGTVTNSERRISRQRKVLPSPGMAKPDWWIISQVAKKMGFTEAFNYLHEGEVFREYAQLSSQGNTQGERDFTLIGLTQLDDKGYSQLIPQQWPVTKLQSQVVNQRFFTNKQFFTPNGRANFVAVSYAQPQSATSSDYPLLLNTGRTRDHWHTMSRTGLSTRLADHKPEPYVLVHPITASEYGVADKCIVKISNQLGECLARVEVSEDVRPKQLFVPIHWNNTTAKGSKPCELVAPYTDKLSGQPEFKHTPVTMAPCQYQSSALFISPTPLDFNNVDLNNVDLSDIDYWARQKVAGGYLYRIESSLPVHELAKLLKTKLAYDVDRLLSFEPSSADGQHRFASLKANKIHQGLYVQPFLTEDVISELIAFYGKEFDADTELSFLQAAEFKQAS